MFSKKSAHSKIGIRITIFLLVACSFLGESAYAATLQISASSATLSPGGIATLSVIVNSEGVAVNNADAKIIFPADLLEVVSVSKGNSVFSLWVEEPAYSNSGGTVSFNGGIPTPGFTGSYGTAVSIVVKAKKAGKADIFFSDSAVRANDGFGTDVLRAKTGTTLTIVQKEEPVKVETETKLVPPTLVLQVTSPTHPSQELWYRDTSPIFRWKVPTGVDAIQTGIDNHTSGSPRVTFSPAISERTVKDQKDGIWHFKVRARRDGEWGPVSTYIARIDNTVPQKNEVTFSFNDEEKVLQIKTDIIDETSGLDHYNIYINEVLIKSVPSGDFVNGVYSLAVDTPGDNAVKLVAVDRAGNSIEALGSFKVTAVPEPELKPTSTTGEPLLVSIGSFAIPALYFAIALLSVIAILVLGAFRLGRSFSTLHHKHLLRTALGKGDNTKVLLLLKKRLEKHLEILQHTRHKRILSKEEKEIKEAIEGDLDEVDRAIDEHGQSSSSTGAI